MLASRRNLRNPADARKSTSGRAKIPWGVFRRCHEVAAQTDIAMINSGGIGATELPRRERVLKTMLEMCPSITTYI